MRERVRRGSPPRSRLGGARRDPRGVSRAWIAAVAIGDALCAAARRRRRSRRRSRPWSLRTLPLILLLGSLGFLGCRGGEEPPASGVSLLPAERSLGGPGTVPGRFRTPRAIDFDPEDGSLWVIDKTARVQRIAPDGRPLGGWTMPDSALGMPTGITVDDAGRVIVPDTHYHRVIVHDREGRELLRFGQYGPEPGRFVYPTDVVVAPDGRF